MYHAKDTDILTANASLYIVGDWCSAENNSKFFERKLLLNGPLAACLEKAVGDERMIDDEMYETCKDCPYYYGEINQCMYGEDVPNNL